MGGLCIIYRKREVEIWVLPKKITFWLRNLLAVSLKLMLAFNLFLSDRSLGSRYLLEVSLEGKIKLEW